MLKTALHAASWRRDAIGSGLDGKASAWAVEILETEAGKLAVDENINENLREMVKEAEANMESIEMTIA